MIMENEEIKQEQENNEQEVVDVDKLDEQPVEKEKFSFPLLGLITIGVLITAIVVLIILLYAFGGPLPSGK